MTPFTYKSSTQRRTGSLTRPLPNPRTPNPTLPTPAQTPESSDLAPRQPAPQSPLSRQTNRSCGRTGPAAREKRPITLRETRGTLRADASSQPPHAADEVSPDLARTVINMQQHYATELAVVSGGLSDLADQVRAARSETAELKVRVDIQVVLLQGVVEFIQQVKEGKFNIAVSTASSTMAEMRLASVLGDEYVRQAQVLANSAEITAIESSNTVAARADVSILPIDPPSDANGTRVKLESTEELDIDPTPDAQLEIATQFANAESIPAPIRDEDELSDIDMGRREAIRSTGLRAPIRLQTSRPSRDQSNKRRKIAKRAALKQSRRRPRLGLNHYSNLVEEAVSELEYCQQSRQLRFRSDAEPVSQTQHTGDNLNLEENELVERRSLTRPEPRGGTAWAAINAPLNDGVGVSPIGDRDSEYEPESEMEDDEDGDEDVQDILTPTPQTPNLPSTYSLPDLPQPSGPKPRYTTARQTTPRYAAGPPNKPFHYQHMGRTVASVWQEYKCGAHGNPPIEVLEERYGTGWRSGTLREIKYGSNYVGVRKMVVKKVEQVAEENGVEALEACRMLDERVDGRLQLLINAVRHDQDPFKVIPAR